MRKAKRGCHADGSSYRKLCLLVADSRADHWKAVDLRSVEMPYSHPPPCELPAERLLLVLTKMTKPVDNGTRRGVTSGPGQRAAVSVAADQ